MLPAAKEAGVCLNKVGRKSNREEGAGGREGRREGEDDRDVAVGEAAE